MAVSVPETENVAEDANGGGGAGIGKAFVEPVVWGLEALHEEVPQHGVEMVADGAEGFDAVVHTFGLRFGDMLAADIRLQILGKMPLVSGHEVVVQWNGIGYELDDARSRGQGEHFVSANAEVTLASGALGM